MPDIGFDRVGPVMDATREDTLAYAGSDEQASDDQTSDDQTSDDQTAAELLARDREAMLNGDVEAYKRVGLATGNPPTDDEIEAFVERGGLPIVDAARAQALMDGGLEPGSQLEQRWDQFQVDRDAVLNGDVEAFKRVGLATGNPPSDAEVEAFVERGGLPITQAARAEALMDGGLEPGSQLDQRWEQFTKDIQASEAGDVDAFARVKLATGAPATPEDLAGFIRSHDGSGTAGLGFSTGTAGTGTAGTGGAGTGGTTGTGDGAGGPDGFGGSGNPAEDALDHFGSGSGFASEDPATGDPGGGDTGSFPDSGGSAGQTDLGGGGSSAIDDALGNLRTGSSEPEIPAAHHSGGDATAPADVPMSSFGSHDTTQSGGSSSWDPTDNGGTDEMTEVRPGVLGYVWVDDGNGGQKAIDPNTGQEVPNVNPPSADAGDTDTNAGTTDDDTEAGTDDSGDDPDGSGDDGATGTAYTTEDAAPLSAHAREGLDILGVSGTTFVQQGGAGPDYGPGTPGDDSGSVELAAGRTLGGINPGVIDPMNPDGTTLESGPVTAPAGATPDYGPRIPGSDIEGDPQIAPRFAGGPGGGTAPIAMNAAMGSTGGAASPTQPGVSAVGVPGGIGAVGGAGARQGGETSGSGTSSSSFAMTADDSDASSSASSTDGAGSDSTDDGAGTTGRIIDAIGEDGLPVAPEGLTADTDAQLSPTKLDPRADVFGAPAASFEFGDWTPAASATPNVGIEGTGTIPSRESDFSAATMSGSRGSVDPAALAGGRTGAVEDVIDSFSGGPELAPRRGASDISSGIAEQVVMTGVDYAISKGFEKVVGEPDGVKAGDTIESPTDGSVGGDTDPRGLTGIYTSDTSTTALNDGGTATRTTTHESFGPNTGREIGMGGKQPDGVNDPTSWESDTTQVARENGTTETTKTTTETYNWGTQETVTTESSDGSWTSTTVKTENTSGGGTTTTTTQMTSYSDGTSLATATTEVKDANGTVTGTETVTNAYDSSGDLMSSTTTTSGNVGGATSGGDDPDTSGGTASAGGTDAGDDGSGDDSGDDSGADDPDADDDSGAGTSVAYTTGDDQPLDAHEQEMLDMLGVQAATFQHASAGPDYGPGVPGDDGGTVVLEAGGSLGGMNPGVIDPMDPDGSATGLESGPVRAPATAGPDFGPTIPGSDSGGGAVYGGPGGGGGVGPISVQAGWGGGSEALAFGASFESAGAGMAAPSAGGMATGTATPTGGRDPSTISGSEDDDLEDLEVQTVTGPTGGGTQAMTSGVAQTEDEAYLGMTTGIDKSSPLLDAAPHSGLGDVGLDMGSPATGTATPTGGRDPSTISGSEDDDLEDLEVQRDVPPSGPDSGTAAMTDSLDGGNATPLTAHLGAPLEAPVDAPLEAPVDAPLELDQHDPAAALELDAEPLAAPVPPHDPGALGSEPGGGVDGLDDGGLP